MNSLFALLGIESWKPVLTALLLPPVPLLLLVLVGTRLVLPRRGWGWTVVAIAVSLLWLSACTGTAQWLRRIDASPATALTAADLGALRSEAAGRVPPAIVVLGAGMEPYAPEYGVASLSAASLERLRYGIWLGRQTGAPVAFSGGIGWAQPVGTPEARVAAQIAAAEYGRPLKWVEDESRDTRENAARSIALLKRAGVRHVVVVTHAYHMPRALRAFEEAARGEMRIQPAPLGLVRGVDTALLAWLPSANGYTAVSLQLREWLARALGA